MNTDISVPSIISLKISLEEKEVPIVFEETVELTPESILSKGFGLTDLWNIRKKGRSFSIYGRHL